MGNRNDVVVKENINFTVCRYPLLEHKTYKIGCRSLPSVMLHNKGIVITWVAFKALFGQKYICIMGNVELHVYYEIYYCRKEAEMIWSWKVIFGCLQRRCERLLCFLLFWEAIKEQELVVVCIRVQPNFSYICFTCYLNVLYLDDWGSFIVKIPTIETSFTSLL